MADVGGTPARALVERFGDPDSMGELYDAEIVWTLPKSSGKFAGPHVGKEVVLAFNRAVWGKLYFPDVGVDIQEESGDDRLSAVRFIYTARIRPDGEPYEVEYAVFARSANERIVEVHEMLDTLSSQEQLQVARNLGGPSS